VVRQSALGFLEYELKNLKNKVKVIAVYIVLIKSNAYFNLKSLEIEKA